MLSSDERTYLFLVQRDGFEVYETRYTKADIEQLVKSIRASVDLAGRTEALPFAKEQAYELYRALIQPFENKLPDIEHLIYIPDGSLNSLPFGLLMDRSSAEYEDFDIAYLQQLLALSTVPSMGALVALRSIKNDNPGGNKLLGIGNPILGAQASILTPMVRTRGVMGEVELDLHSQLSPLAETEQEINTIADSFEEKTLLMKNAATETALRNLPNLKDYGVIVFATHGLLRNDSLGISEPALVMTRDPKNNGLLLASEIADLSLNANWVVLSACNTAGTDGSPRAEGLSGLAKAFFFAGARGLLLSHWEVSSLETVKITTGTIKAYKNSDRKLGRAFALKETLGSLIDGRYGSRLTHPAYWAPFVLVGDGAY